MGPAGGVLVDWLIKNKLTVKNTRRCVFTVGKMNNFMRLTKSLSIKLSNDKLKCVICMGALCILKKFKTSQISNFLL